MTAAAIHVEGLTKSFSGLDVLKGVDFDVARGSIFALLGSNGAGKTTLVRILSTMSKADAGTATVDGFDVETQAADVRESISLTGQFAAVDDVLTGRENLLFIAKLRHVDDPGAVADDLLARFSLTEAGGRRAATYSGGMRRRLDIAMSLMGDPSVIFLDEPTTGLDPRGAHRGVADHQAPRGGGDDRAAHDAVPRRGRAARRSHRDPAPRRHHPERHARSSGSSLPAATAEYVEKQPSLEDVFLALVGSGREPAQERKDLP